MNKLIIGLMMMVSSAAIADTKIQFNKENTIVLSGPVTGQSAGKVFEAAREMDTDSVSSDPIYLLLDTPGGDIQAGMELIENLKGLNRPVHTVTLFAASMGFQTVQGLGTRYVLRNGILMSHEAYGGFEGSFSHGKSQIDAIYGLWLERVKEMDLVTVKRSNGKQTLDSYRNAYSKDLWLTGNQAVKGGYADEVVGARCGLSLKGEREETVMFFGTQLLVKWSLCPLNTYPLSVEAMVETNEGLMTLSKFNKRKGVNGYVRDPLTDVSIADPEVYSITTVDVKAIMKAAEEFRTQKVKEIDDRKPIRY